MQFLPKYDVTTSGCWEWNGGKTAAGYGTISSEGTTSYAHRVSYEHHIGPIPEGLTIDHLCRNPPCVNPEHLEAVTIRENIMRGNGISVRQLRAIEERGGVCPRGHDAYTLNKHGYRYCAECHRIRQRELKRKRSAAKIAAGTYGLPGRLLSTEQRAQIVRDHREGKGGYGVLARRYGCSKTFVQDLVKGR